DGVHHLLGTSGAIHANDVDRIGLQSRQRCRDVRANEHGANRWCLDRDLSDNGQALADCPEIFQASDNGSLGLQKVLARLKLKDIAYTVSQASYLVVVSIFHVQKADVSKRGQLGGRTD